MRPAHLPPPSGSGELPPPEGGTPGGCQGDPGRVSLNPSNKIFSKNGLRGLDKIAYN